MIGFLRFVGIVNAAVWFGSTFFFTLVGGPVFFSEDAKLFFRDAFPVWSQSLWFMSLGKYYALQQVCAFIALLHLLAEWLYTGKGLPRALVYALIGLCAVAVLGGHAIQPKLKQWHRVRYAPGYTVQQQKEAENALAVLRGFVHVTNVLAAATLLVYVWRLNSPNESPRFGKRR